MDQKNKITYVHLKDCPPCKALTPIIDTFIACGYEIEKVDHHTYTESSGKPPSGTPSIVVNSGQENEAVYPSNILVGAINFLSSNHIRDLNVINFSTIPEFIKKILDK